MKQKLIAQGAEAKIFLSGNAITKDRIKKSYRIKELDDKIRKSRTKKEIKLLTKASQIINVPLPLTDSRGGDWGSGGAQTKLKIPFIKGEKLSEHLDKFPLKKQKQICRQVGQDIAKLHDNNIIHGDLTTSNMIFVKNIVKKPVNNKTQNDARLTTSPVGGGGAVVDKNKLKIYFIDFGLGFISHKYEDRAVDIHLLKQAIEAKHYKNYKILIKEFLKGYKTSKNSAKNLKQLNKVEKRGRYKH